MDLRFGDTNDTVRKSKSERHTYMHRFQKVILDGRVVGNVELHLFPAVEGFGITTVIHVKPEVNNAL